MPKNSHHTPPQMGLVYSYMRFSSEKQRNGNSFDRQSRYAEAWAAEHGMTLDDSLTMRDEGLSAFHQKHVKTGALGVFLRSIENDMVLPGSVLIVEGLDRLSRAEPLIAQAQLASIINAGITVVTAADGKQYSRESIKANPMDLIYSLLVMIRAHEESDTKSRRIKSAFQKQYQGWENGTNRGKVGGGLDPKWVRWDASEKRFTLVEDEAAKIRKIIALWLDGYSGRGIRNALVQQFGDDGKHYISNGSDISSLLYERHHLFIGMRVISANGTEYRLAGYYPALIDEHTYNALVSSFQTRPRRQGRESANVPSILTGTNGLFRCGYCDSVMAVHRPAADKPNRINCANRQCMTRSVSLLPIEQAVITFCSDQMNLNSLVGRDETAEIKNRISAARVSVAALERQLSRVLDAMLATDSPPASFAAKAKQIEEEIAHHKHTIRNDESVLLAAAGKPSGVAADQWRALADAAINGDFDARIRLRRLVSETFSRVAFYRYAMTPPAAAPKWQREPFWEMLLVSKSGVSRNIRVSRSGELLGLVTETRQAAA